jgi:hypothetical protein
MVYHQYINLIAYYITIVVPSYYVVLNVTSSPLTKCTNLHVVLAHTYKSESTCKQNIEVCKIAHICV